MSQYEEYRSPFSWRYGSEEMRQIWSEIHTRQIWRHLWILLAEVQREFGLTTTDQINDLKTHEFDIDLDRAYEIESQIHHDLMAEIRTYSEQCLIGGGIIHLGATSVDIKDNATILQIKDSLNLIIDQLIYLLLTFADLIDCYNEFPIIGFTHLQPAEPTTLGYRLAQNTQDLFTDLQNLLRIRKNLLGKGFKGSVGTSASFAELMGKDQLPQFEIMLSQKLGINFFPVTTQTYPRKQDYEILCSLAGIGASIYKFAFDLRFLQTPPIGEVAEPFGVEQVGSSAMPFKRNPIISEKMNSLARFLAQYPRTAWDNAANSILERTLDDSANRRTLIPEAFLITDELLHDASVIIKNISIDENAMKLNLDYYGPFAAVERLLMALCKAGADRQKMHEKLRVHSLTAIEAIKKEQTNPLKGLLQNDPEIMSLLAKDEFDNLMNYQEYIGDAAKRAKSLVKNIRSYIQSEI